MNRFIIGGKPRFWLLLSYIAAGWSIRLDIFTTRVVKASWMDVSALTSGLDKKYKRAYIGPTIITAVIFLALNIKLTPI